MDYGDYIANLTQLAVDISNAGTAHGLEGISAELFTDHRVTPPADAELAQLLPPLRAALESVVGERDLLPINELLSGYPPNLHVSLHDGPQHPHLHHAQDGEAGLTWVGRSCAAALAHLACGLPEVSVGRCAAADCGKFFVDRSRHRSRKFCGNACARRTTVAAYRARKRA